MSGPFRVLDLFSGIGGFSLGLERTGGFETVAFCEIEPFCQKVLAKHWPGVPIYGDVRELTADTLSRDGIAVDAICGGFPCQDVSLAGSREGLDGERSGLWSEYRRLVGDLRPEFVIVENTPGLLSLGMGDVLGDLSALGYDAEWHCISAAAVGADHLRDRVWIIGYPNADRSRKLQSQGLEQKKRGWTGNRVAQDSTNPGGARLSRRLDAGEDDGHVAIFGPRLRSAIDTQDDISREFWNHKPILGRGLHGVSDRLDRVRALGNAVVPQIPELIGRAILNSARCVEDVA